MSGGRAAAKFSGQPSGQMFQPLKRHLPFPSSTPPPFINPDAYHRFDDVSRRNEDEVTDVLVIKTPVSDSGSVLGIVVVQLVEKRLL